MTDNRFFELIYRSCMTFTTVIFFDEGGACVGLRLQKLPHLNTPVFLRCFYFFVPKTDVHGTTKKPIPAYMVSWEQAQFYLLPVFTDQKKGRTGGIM
jgi:hypothetical protein